MPPKTESASSVEEFVKKASEVTRRWFPNENEAPLLPWFRGQEKAEWALVPKLYRPKPGDLQTEYEIREDFTTRAPALSDYIKPTGHRVITNWEWYFVMQHYGAPTRLLDWTDGALIALYFAVRANQGDFPAAVWMIDPWWLNKTVIHKDEVIPPADPGILPEDRKTVAPWLPLRFKKKQRLPKLPVAIVPSHTMRRISAQRSCFTIHGTEHDGFGQLTARDKHARLVKITIPSWEVKQIRRSLDACGIDETTIFPDLEALGRSVTLSWKSEKSHLPHQGVYTRLRPSKTHGVGLLAIKNIKRGTKLFNDEDGMVWIDKDKLGRLPKEIMQLYKDFAVLKNGRYGCPPNFNQLTPAWYINESRKHPNVHCDQNYDFVALKDIEPDEELTVDYSTYSEDDPS